MPARDNSVSIPSGESGPAGHPLWKGAVAGLVAVLTTVLSVVAFPPLDLPEAAYLWAVPFLTWVYLVNPSWRLTALVAGLAQFAGWLILLRWLRHFPEHAGVAFPGLIGGISLILLALVVASFGTVWLLAARWVMPRCRSASLPFRLLMMLGLASAWVVLEWIRATLFTGFPWLPLAASQWQRPLILQVAAYTGAWGVSFVLILFNLGLVFYLRTFLETRRMAWWKRFSAEFYLALGALFLALGVDLLDERRGVPQPAFAAGFVQPAILPQARWEFEQVEEVHAVGELVAQYAAFDGADALLWPEGGSSPLPAPGHAYAEGWLTDLSAGLGLPILMGSLVLAPGDDGEEHYHNGIITVDPEEGLGKEFYAKRHLVPFGEYVPGWLPFLDKVVPLEGGFTPGRDPQVLDWTVRGREWKVGALICYEDLFADLAREQAREGVSFFYVATNDIWYGREGAAYQHASHSVLRAVETRRPVLRAGNEGWSGWIDERGRIRHVLRGADGSIYFRGADAEMVYIDPRYQGLQSFYVRYGDWFVRTAMLVTAAAAFTAWWSRRISGAQRQL